MKNCIVAVCFILLGMPMSLIGQEGSLKKEIVDMWRSYKATGKGTVADYLEQKEKIDDFILSKNREDSYALMENRVETMLNVWRYHVVNPDAAFEHKKEIKKLLKSIDIYSDEFLSDVSAVPRVNAYFNVWALMDGASVEQLLNDDDEYVYRKYKILLESGHEKMMLRYFPCLKITFLYGGYTLALKRIRPLLNKHLPEGELKDELMTIYERYDRYLPGKPAPEFCMVDLTGKERTLKDFAGKIAVFDVWATWCSGCVAHLPDFVNLAKKYEGRDDIVFIAVSQDRNHNDWKKGVERLKASSLVNLFCSATFAKDYNIPGIPLYMIIDEEGKFITSKVPINALGDKLEGVEKLIEETLKKRK